MTGSPESLATRLVGMPEGGVAVSILFVPICDGGSRVERNASLALPPASVQKVVTSAAALDLLGPDHRFSTQILAGGPIRDGVLDGSLYIRGGGDPFLVSERLWLLAREISALGIRVVKGPLVIDPGRVTDLDSLRSIERTDSPYASPVSMLAVNFNSLSFLLRPAERAGSPAHLALDPFPLPQMKLLNQVGTVAVGDAVTPIAADRRIEGSDEIWRFEGSIALESPPIRLYKASRDPALLAGGIIHGLLAAEGISIGPPEVGAPPSEARLILEFPSLSLGSLVRSMNLWSNNFMADLLLADIGGQASARAGTQRIRVWLSDRVGMKTLPRIADGCGLAASNRISAAQIVEILLWASSRERVFPDLYASFPRPGGEGTLERRFKAGSAPSLRAKTGTLGDSGVSSIAGYLDRPDGTRYAFCILQQADSKSGLRVHDLREREEAWLLEFASP